MGLIWCFGCRKCGKRYDVSLGCGMAYRDEMISLRDAILAGEYGEDRAAYLAAQPEAECKPGRYLYTCPACGHWVTGRDATLYRSETVDIPPTLAHPWAQRVTKRHVLMPFQQACPTCGVPMDRLEQTDLEQGLRLRCPDCGTENHCWASGFWD